jgi:4-diphosphocytidyl-2-C-methyl-D-erythritol kinase
VVTAALVVELAAHAKLTTTLRVTGVRDDGFHLIDAEMVSLDLHDTITIEPRPGGPTTIEVTGPFADGVPVDGSNLVAGALELVGRRARITIDKQIPNGGGLGGGSADAGAVLRWAGFGAGPDDLRRAGRLGADVPFTIVGGRARVTGIGDVVTPLPHIERAVVLVIPPLRVSTPAVYRAWDDLGGPTGDGRNDLEPAALVVEPRLRWWRDAIGERLGRPPTLAGSGATWFADVTPVGGAGRDDALDDLVDEGARVVMATTVPSR